MSGIVPFGIISISSVGNTSARYLNRILNLTSAAGNGATVALGAT